ncbi:MAG TPA: GNAT family N-acetyltransferase, partial [Gaiellaceae bacterium]|nr:GNAT family N-acetyltransferase [Gaiellaceae bacterium]
MTVSIRRAGPDDLDFLVELLEHEEVDPFLAAGRTRGRDALAAEVERSRREPERFGRFVIEADGERAGTMRFELVNARSRIADLGGLAVHPGFRGRRVADEAARLLQRHLLGELGYHRLQLEIYGFNERAQRHAGRAGFVREGVRRRAYRHGDGWVDGVLYGLTAEDLAGSAPAPAPPPGRASAYDRAMTRYLHTMLRVVDPQRSRAFYEALGMEFRRELPIVRDGHHEATNYFYGFPGQDEELELTWNTDGRTYELGTAYGHVAFGVE